MGLLPRLMQFNRNSFAKVCSLRGFRTSVGAISATALFGIGASTLPSAAQTCPVNTPHIQGVWRTLPYLMPINPISATLMHTGKVLIVAGSENDASNNSSGSESYRNAVWDPTGTTGSSVTVQEIAYDVFCSGTAALPDGRPLVIGGTSDYSFKGDNRASIFDPATTQFLQSQSMANGRWYGTATALGDGRIMAFSGLNLSGGTNNTVEVYDLTNAGAGWTSPVTAPFSPPLYPRMFLLPSGKVFYTGQGSGTNSANSWIFDPAAMSWTQSVATTMNRSYGSAVILPLLPPNYTPQVMSFGGGGNPSTATTEIIDLSAASPSWTAGPSMSTGRIQMNAVILPNGKVLAEGGSLNNESPDTPGKRADLYDPVSQTFSSGGTAAYSRLYHSTALLLPDATVMSMGSNPGSRGSYEPAIEIYTPPYLFDANDNLITTARPVITGVTPGVIGYNATFYVNYTSASSISSAVLVRPGSVTHAIDMDQRLIGLCGPSPQPACVGSGQLNLTTPPNGNIAPPGYYMLFLLDSAGVPSVAQFIQLSPYTTSAPNGIISSPASDTTIGAGHSVSFGTTTTSAKYSWIFPGGSPATSTAQNPGNVRFNTPGEYTVSLTEIDATGNSDPSPSTRTIKVLPASANFDISVSPSANTVLPGNSTTFNVTVTPLSGFNGSVSLSVGSENGFPTGITSGGFSPTSISGSGSSTLTMNTTTSTAPYALSLTVTGTSGSITHTGSTTLLVNLAAPASLTATPNGIGQIALSWPASVSATSYHVKRSSVSGGPYVTVGCTSASSYTDSGLANGTTYYYVVSAAYNANPDAGGESTDSTEASATTPSFSITPSSGSVSIVQGSNSSVNINTSALNGFNNAVALSITGVPASVTSTFTPASIAAPGTGSSNLNLAVGATAVAGTYTLTVKGTGGGVTQTTTVTLTVTATLAAMTSPAPGSTLTGSSTTFTWNAVTGASQYYLWIGTTPGGTDLAQAGTSGTSYTANLPTNGATIYVRLYTQINGQLQYNSYTYTEYTSALAAMTSPVPGSTLTGSSTTFTWNAVTGASQYYLWIGTTPGGTDLAQAGTSGTSYTANLPTNGATIYVRLYTQINGQLQYNSYTYTEYMPVPAAMISPVPASTLNSGSTTFTWNAGTGVSYYYLWIGTTPGGTDLAQAGMSGTSYTANLPSNGATIYVRLYSVINNTLQYKDYSYIEAP